MGHITILEETTRYPITLMGSRAGICWGRIFRIRIKIISGAWNALRQVMEGLWSM